MPSRANGLAHRLWGVRNAGARGIAIGPGGGVVGYLKARDTASPVGPGYFDEAAETRAP